MGRNPYEAEDIDTMWERDMEHREQELHDEWWKNNPERPRIEAEMAEQERFDKTIRGKVFYWRVVEEVSWLKTIWYIIARNDEPR